MDEIINKLKSLLKSPRETLDIEIKDWLDLNKKEHQACLIQAILALANSGGGHILIGFKEISGSYQATNTETDIIELYNQDRINGIVRRYADPQIQVDCYTISNGENNHPVIVVPGGHSVPIRCARGGPDNKHVKQNSYYIRRPGPTSEEPQTGHEWADLIRRCVLADKEKLVEQLKLILSGESKYDPREFSQIEEVNNKWIEATFKRFMELVQKDFVSLENSPYKNGYWFGAYSIFPQINNMSLASLRDSLQKSQGRETGWPIGLFLTHESTKPYNGNVEAWLAESIHDPGSSDYWRSSPEGSFAIIRGYQEDIRNASNENIGKWLDFIIPIWRIGELLLHASRFVGELASNDSSIIITVKWTGLSGRRLKTSSHSYMMPINKRANQNEVLSSLIIQNASMIDTNLPEYVEQILCPLFEAFDFFQVPSQTIINELKRMRNRV